ncbi:MAG: ATP-binding protein, partial [Bacteroidota bacterium]
LNKNISGQVSSIECDEDLGLVWVSSLKKLLCYAPTQQQLKTFLPEDGIPNGMNLRASYQDADGNLYFGGMDSYISFYSADIPSNTFEPSDKVSITALKIAGEEVKIGTIDPYTNQAILQQSISNTEQILLSTAHRGIKIEFTMLDYSSSRYNYMYRLQGFEKDWHYTDEQNNESYQQLPAGDYVFEVKASNSDGFESQPTRLAVCVRAPFIQTTTFKFIVTIWVLLLLYALYSYKTYIIQREKRQLELLVQERTEALQHQNQQKEAALAVAQEQRSKAERANAAKTVFLTTMSHEVRTPMHGILGIAQLLEKTTMDIIQKEYLRAMQRNSKQLLYIVNDILDYTKLESGMMELDIRSFHLQKCIEEVIQILQPRAQEKELQLLYELSETAPKYIQTDSTRLQQILINLVGNSIKFTDQGSITVKIAVDIQPSKPWLKIVVEDTGIGIKEEKLNILFEAFSQADDSMTRRHGGMGLGLTICAGLLRLLGGTLDINTVVHKGTRIDLSIPVQIEDQQLAALKDQEQHHIPDHETASYYPANILIAEDNKFNRMLLDKVLSRLGYNATFVNTGLEAVKAAEGADFDLIFMDLNMPEMSGIEATEIILNRHKHQPTVVALTANAQKEIKEACLAAGMKKFVSKPFKVDYIRKIIIEYINYEPPI